MALEFKVNDLICIDFETFWDSKAKDQIYAPKGYTLRKMTTEQFVRHPWYQTIGVAVTTKTDGELKSYWMTHEQFKQFASWYDWSKAGVICHHAHFDGLIMGWHYGIKPGMWFDTLSMARAVHSHETSLSLGALMDFYDIGTKGDYPHKVDGVQVHDLTPEQFKEYGEYAIGDSEGTMRLFDKMRGRFTASELEVIDMTVRMFTEPAFVADEDKLRHYLETEFERKDQMFKQLNLTKASFSSSDKFAELLREQGVEPPMKKSPKWTEENQKMIYAFAKSDPAMQMLLEHDDEVVRWLAEARVAAKSTIGESRTERFLKLGRNQRPMPVYLAYSAAHTHRWGGGDSLNWQNLPRGGVIKDSILAPEGQMIIAADSAQIEARGTGWFCGQDDLLADFATGEDVYSKFASVVYGRQITKADKIERFVGKTCILGLGFGMGFVKLAATFERGAMGGPPLFFSRDDAEALGVDVEYFKSKSYKIDMLADVPTKLSRKDLITHAAVCDHIVRVWREKNSKIMEMHKHLNDWVIPMMAAGHAGNVGPHGCVMIQKYKLILPSGLALHYKDLKQEKGEWKYQIKPKQRTKLYGGLLLENLVQALSRDIIASQALEIHQQYPVRTLTHDEVVTVVPTGEAEGALNNILEVMSRPPAWAASWPLAAEGGIAKRYGGIK